MAGGMRKQGRKVKGQKEGRERVRRVVEDREEGKGRWSRGRGKGGTGRDGRRVVGREGGKEGERKETCVY